MKSLYLSLTNWISALDVFIKEQKLARDKIDRDIKESCDYQEDVLALLNYIDSTDLPDGVQRGLKRCLEWNPHANK